MINKVQGLLTLSLLIALASCTSQSGGNTFVLSVVTTNDVHGEMMQQSWRGGLGTLSAYVAALRDAREQDGGAVLLIDAGDMWQGTLESNLAEGASVVQAYNAIGFTAATIGNHEFDFGPLGPLAVPESEDDDARGALKQRAREADFPLLAANLIDEATGRPVDWENVSPSAMVTVNGVKIGIIGVTSRNSLRATIAANVRGLRVAPLVETITVEAEKLRADGAAMIIVTAHSGSRCEDLSDPEDLSSCYMQGEIMQVAQALPAGLVDHIAAGHSHQSIAHIVNGISITSSWSNTFAFGRTDFVVDPSAGTVTRQKVFAPQSLCTRVLEEGGDCAYDDSAPTVAAAYEGRPLVAMPEVVEIVNAAVAATAERKAQKIGITLETSFAASARPESELGNLLTTAMLESVDADISVHNVAGGIRAPLPAGELTYGDLYRMFPFDNRVVVVELSGTDLREVIGRQATTYGRRAGFAGMRVFVDCSSAQMGIEMRRDDGTEITDSDQLRVAANDFLAWGGDDILATVMPAEGFDWDENTELMRDTLEKWFAARGGVIRAEMFLDADAPRWNLPEEMPADCRW